MQRLVSLAEHKQRTTPGHLRAYTPGCSDRPGKDRRKPGKSTARSRTDWLENKARSCSRRMARASNWSGRFRLFVGTQSKLNVEYTFVPVFDRYQVGQNNQKSTLGDDLVWSAAYAPPATPTAAPTPSAATSAGEPGAVPSPGTCLPDAPGGMGCPLYVPGSTTLPPGSGVDCARVCDEYGSCLQTGGVQKTGFTCDATLCTDECNNRDLLGTACSELAQCDISEIVKAETAAQCSCCASQLCGCSPNGKTNTEIAVLDQQQRDRGIKPQCDINGTLCGSP